MKTVLTYPCGLAGLTVLALLAGGLGQAGAAIIYTEDFEDGIADGFTWNIVEPSGSPGLWHVTSNFPFAGNNALGYVRIETPNSSTPDGDYDIGNVVSTSFGPAIAIPAGNYATLTFEAFVGDEWDPSEPDINQAQFDQFSVWASADTTFNPGSDTVLASSEPSAGGVNIPEWKGDGGSVWYNTISVDLSSFAGQSIYLAYRFDPAPGIDLAEFNEFPGIRVDNISLDVNPVPEAPTWLLVGIGLVAIGGFRRKWKSQPH
jgi:hypothetical protein